VADGKRDPYICIYARIHRSKAEKDDMQWQTKAEAKAKYRWERNDRK
jgi:hypothetical protein